MRRCLVLAGPPGAGKSTVGAACAARLGWRFLDTDAELARRHGLAVAAIFARHGEPYFRAQEAELLAELATATQVVLSVGGGAVVPEPSRALLRRLGVCVCLTATPGELARRLGPGAAATRPLLVGASVEQRLAELLADRAAAYSALPYYLDTSKLSVDEVAARVCALVAAEDERLIVTHPTGSYDLVLGTDLLPQLGYALAGRRYQGPLAILSDTHVGPLYAGRVQASLAAAGLPSFVHLIEAGEAHKNLDTLAGIYQALSIGGVLRRGAVLALGGGVVGDVAGLAAATYLRGVALVQVPTSLLAMADSSIGGKVGVDTPAGKNLVGAFKHPDLVFMDLACLRTLPPRELVAGLGEIVKAALIAGGEVYARVQALPAVTADSPALLAVLGDALRTKRILVQEDPEEHGRRILLNLGHTFAHGLEPYSGYELRHGEAVALGLLCAAQLAAGLGLCPPSLRRDLVRLFHRLGLPTMLPIASQRAVQEDLGRPGQAPSAAGCSDDHALRSRLVEQAVESIWAFMQHDKKRLSRRIRFVLLRAPGDVFPSDLVDEQLAKEALRALFGEDDPGEPVVASSLPGPARSGSTEEHGRGPSERPGLMRERG
jgi:3-dehydroquinate synthase